MHTDYSCRTTPSCVSYPWHHAESTEAADTAKHCQQRASSDSQPLGQRVSLVHVGLPTHPHSSQTSPGSVHRYVQPWGVPCSVLQHLCALCTHLARPAAAGTQYQPATPLPPATAPIQLTLVNTRPPGSGGGPQLDSPVHSSQARDAIPPLRHIIACMRAAAQPAPHTYHLHQPLPCSNSAQGTEPIETHATQPRPFSHYSQPHSQNCAARLMEALLTWPLVTALGARPVGLLATPLVPTHCAPPLQ